MMRLLLLLLPLAAWADLPQAAVSPAPGRYTAAVSVSVTVPDGTAVLYRFLESSDPRSLPWAAPLTLDAMPGETRSYSLRLTTQLPSGEAVVRDFTYTIARSASGYPTVKPVPGTYSSRIALVPALPDGWTLTENGEPLREAPVLDAPEGSRRTFVFEARGPEQSVVWRYDIDRRDQDAALEVVSPAPGNWANRQQLAVVFRGLDRVVWSYGEALAEVPSEYQGPVTLDGGARSVTVAGRTRDGRWIEKRVSWTSGQAERPPAWPAEGVRTETADFPETEGWSFSWDEGRSWQTAGRREAVPSQSRKIVVAQARNGSGVSRYVYWFDARAPQKPELRFEGGWNPRLDFSGSPEALHRVTWTFADGKTRQDAAQWGPIGSWKVPDGVTGARVMVTAANGIEAEAALAFAETGWVVPRWENWESGPRLPVGGRVVLRPGFVAAYEVASSPDVAEPGPASPWLDGAFLPAVPWGADRTFYVRFAWRDAGGLTGPASPVYAVRVDRLPPPLPTVREDEGRVAVVSENDASLWWAVTADRVSSADAVAFQPYTGPVDRASLASGKLWFHARAQDRVGNLGPARLNVALTGTPTGVVQVDADPLVGDTPVADGGVYPWRELRLRAETPGLWVAAADARAGLPPTWAAELQPWNGLFTRSVANDRRGFLVYWNLKTADGWAWPQPRSLTLTLDRGPPATPVGTPWPTAPVAQPWTLTMQPGQTGDSLRYSFTLDGSAPADPVTSGQPWPGSRTWEAPAGQRTTLRVRVAAVSTGGMTSEIPAGTVEFDRRSPSAANVPLEQFTYRSAPYTVPGPAGTIRYTLTADGSTPGIPGADSPLVGDGLVLSGTAGQTVLYRFRWRAYSAAGEPGPVSDPYSVLVDRTASPPSADRGASDTVPLLAGIPDSGISAQPVAVRNVWSGSLRYELQEGLGTPPAVTAGSPLWNGTLTLGAEGVDRTYTLHARGYSPDGQPLTSELRYVVRVDLSPPSAAAFDLAADKEAKAVLNPVAGNADETLEYRWQWQSYPHGGGQTDWMPLPSARVFEAPGGEMTRLTVQVRLRDEAGNTGPVTEKSAFLDQNVVYVAPGATGDGSRASPAGKVADAANLARRTGRNVLFLVAGSYLVDRSLDLTGLKVYGGWSSAWEAAPAAGRSLWTQAAGFQGTALVTSSGTGWTLAGVDLFAARGLAQVVSVQGGAVIVRDSAWTWGAADQGWKQTGGSLALSNVSAVYNAKPRGSFLALDSVSAAIDGLNLAAGGNQEGMLFVALNSNASVTDLVVVSKNGAGYDGVWQSDGGILNLSGARISAGEGASRSLGFRLKGAAAAVSRLDLSLSSGASNTAFQLTGGSLSVTQSAVGLLRGTEFNQGVVADHAQTSLSSFALKIETGTYQGGFNLDGGSLSLQSGTVSVAGGGQQAWGGRFRGGTLVNFDGVTWTLGRKTPGQTWLLDAPWAEGSTNKGSTVNGW